MHVVMRWSLHEIVDTLHFHTLQALVHARCSNVLAQSAITRAIML